MKRFFFLLSLVLIISALMMPAFASAVEGDDDAGSDSSVMVVVPDVVVNNEVNIPDDTALYLGADVSTYSMTGSGSSLKSILLQFIGSWETTVIEYSYETSDGSIQLVHQTVPDWPWLASAALLCIVFFCIFRLGGAILCKT